MMEGYLWWGHPILTIEPDCMLKRAAYGERQSDGVGWLSC